LGHSLGSAGTLHFFCMVRFARTFFVFPCSDSMAVIDYSRFTIPNLVPHVCELCDLRVMPKAPHHLHLHPYPPQQSFAKTRLVRTRPPSHLHHPSPAQPSAAQARPSTITMHVGGTFHHSSEEPRTGGEGGGRSASKQAGTRRACIAESKSVSCSRAKWQPRAVHHAVCRTRRAGWLHAQSQR
jgi:hypothetical protein